MKDRTSLRWFGLVFISLAVALIIVDSTIVNVAVPAIVDEILAARQSERVGRIIDHVGSSMEDKKREGYF